MTRDNMETDAFLSLKNSLRLIMKTFACKNPEVSQLSSVRFTAAVTLATSGYTCGSRAGV